MLHSSQFIYMCIYELRNYIHFLALFSFHVYFFEVRLLRPSLPPTNFARLVLSGGYSTTLVNVFARSCFTVLSKFMNWPVKACQRYEISPFAIFKSRCGNWPNRCKSFLIIDLNFHPYFDIIYRDTFQSMNFLSINPTASCAKFAPKMFIFAYDLAVERYKSAKKY